MVFNAFTISLFIISLMSAAVAVITGSVYWATLSVGLQQAGDSQESNPEDLTEFQERHTYRSEVST